MGSLVNPLYDYVKFNESSSDAHLLTFLRSSALDWACRLGNADCIQNSRNYFTAWMNNPTNDE